MRIDRILCSKRVFTGLTDSAEELAIAVSGDKIAFVGSKEDALALAREADENAEPEVVDYGDALLPFCGVLFAPGFQRDSKVARALLPFCGVLFPACNELPAGGR